MQSSKVPCRPGTVPWLRGTISYQAPDARPRPVGDHRDGSAAGQVAARVACGDGLGEFVREQDLDIRGAVELPLGALDQAFAVGIASVQLAEEFAAFLRLKREIKARLALEQQSLPPGSELVGPGFDRKQIAAGLRRRETAVPAVVAGESASARGANRSRIPSATAVRRPAGRGPRGANRPILQWASPAIRLIG